MLSQEQTAETSITGAWVLDLSRSETLQGYLLCLGTPEAAVNAQVAVERAHQSRNVIALNESTLVIHKSTAVHQYTEQFGLGKERVTPSRSGDGSNHALVCLRDETRPDGYVVATNTIAESGRQTLETVETRQLTDGGHAHIQQISVHRIATGERCTVTRVWARVPITLDDRMRLLC